MLPVRRLLPPCLVLALALSAGCSASVLMGDLPGRGEGAGNAGQGAGGWTTSTGGGGMSAEDAESWVDAGTRDADTGNAGDAAAPAFKAVAVSAGYLSTCVLTATNSVKCWGAGNEGLLGNGSIESSYVPVDVVGLPPVTSISVGGYHACVLTQAGGVRCWGRGAYGALGNGITTQSAVPVEVQGLSSGATAIATGGSHSCAITSTGGVKCWGDNSRGQLGSGATSQSSVPVDVVGLSSGVVAISASDGYTCALLSTGALDCWGCLPFEPLCGTGPQLYTLTPAQVLGTSSGFVAMSAGWEDICALTADGRVSCWGRNRFGEVGLGTTGATSIPSGFVDLTNSAIAVTVGEGFTCALTSARGVKCWGTNYNGELGNGTGTDSAVPVAVTGLSSGVLAISGSFMHTCAITAAGGVHCWGPNEHGELGVSPATLAQSLVPVEVTGF